MASRDGARNPGGLVTPIARWTPVGLGFERLWRVILLLRIYSVVFLEFHFLKWLFVRIFLLRVASLGANFLSIQTYCQFDDLLCVDKSFVKFLSQIVGLADGWPVKFLLKLDCLLHRVSKPLFAFGLVLNHLRVSAKVNFACIFEANLDHVVAEAENSCMLCLHPLLDVALA